MASGTLTNAAPDSDYVNGNLVDNLSYLSLYVGGASGNFDGATVNVQVTYEDPTGSPTWFNVKDQSGNDIALTTNGNINVQIKCRAWRLHSTSGGSSQSIPWQSIG